MNSIWLMIMFVPFGICIGYKMIGKHNLISNEEIKYLHGMYAFEDDDINFQLLSDIEDNMKRKEILSILLNTEYSIHHKMNVIEKYRFLIDIGERKQSMYVQDLLDDWNFEIK